MEPEDKSVFLWEYAMGRHLPVKTPHSRAYMAALRVSASSYASSASDVDGDVEDYVAYHGPRFVELLAEDGSLNPP